MLRHVCIYIIIVFCRSLCCKVKVYFATKSIQGKVMKNHSRNVRCWQSQPSWTELNEKSAERIREGGKRRRSSGCRKRKEWKFIVRRGIENLKPISHASYIRKFVSYLNLIGFVLGCPNWFRYFSMTDWSVVTVKCLVIISMTIKETTQKLEEWMECIWITLDREPR